jgi:meso-butanediol dehydrogenase/(S,S)-butanediol dehydrogenase/diacetyl reductase
MNQDLLGRVALITGAGAGIGRETALQMAARGAIVCVNDLKEELVTPVVDEIKSQGGQAFAIVQNIASREGIRAAIQRSFEYVIRPSLKSCPRPLTACWMSASSPSSGACKRPWP